MKTTTKPKNTLRLAGAWLCSKATTACIGAASLLLLSNSSAPGADVTWTFDTDPTLLTEPHPIKVYQGQTFAFKDSTTNSVYWKPAGGNPGGFLGVTWPIGSSSSIVLFPDIDTNGVVTSFHMDMDLRIGNPQQTVRAADGFSINFARINDPVFVNHDPNDFATPGAVETGTTTGLSVIFDTWAGNQLPGGEADIEGIIVRVDNVTVLKQAMPTRNGACTDVTSLQTGNRNEAYWTAVKANGFNQDFNATDLTATPPISPDAAFVEASWTNLCWQHLDVELDLNSRLTVIYKGVTNLDHFQTEFFPSAGGIVLAGRTGGADEHTHFDNIRLQTTASAADNVAPTTPTGVAAASPVGSSRVVLSWNPATDASGRVGYEVSRDDLVLATALTVTNFVDTPPLGNHTYNYKVVAFDIANNRSAAAALDVTTAADTMVVGTVRAQIYDKINGTAINDLLGSAQWNAKTPNRTRYALGGLFGSPNGTGGWNETYGDNYGAFFSGTLTPPETGDYTFFIRSDDASQFFIHTDATIPDPAFDAPLVLENQCCHEFQEPTSDMNLGLVTGSDGGMTSTNPITLTKGTSYGFAVLIKEGGGGDGVGVAMRIAGDTTPAASLPPISGLYVQGASDPLGSSLTILTQPVATSVIENEATSLSVAITNNSFYGTAKWYQWLKNGNPIRNATGPTLSIPVAALADNAAQIVAVVGNEGLVQTSSVAILTVTADTKKPTIVTAAQSDDTFQKLTLKFSEPVTAPTATTAGSYTLSSGATVSAATLSPDGFTVTLTTSTLTPDTAYTLTVNNVADNAGNAIAASTAVPINSRVKVLVAEPQVAYFGNIGGTAVSALTADTRYPATPDSTFAGTNGLTIGSANGNAGWNDSFGDNYGIRVTGVLTPPGTAQYNFFIRSDDASQFFLNTTGATLPDTSGTPTAREDGCCNAFQEPGAAQTSAAISLTAGQQYGYVVLLKEGGGGDGVGVALRGVGDTTPAANLAPISTFAPKFVAPPTGITLAVTQAGGNVTITWSGGGTLQTTAALNGAATVWADVTPAASPYTTPASAAAAFFRVKP